MIEFKIVDNKKAIAQVYNLAKEIWNQHYLPIIGQEQVDYMLDKFQSERAIKEQIAEGYKYYLIIDNQIDNQVEVGYFSVKDKAAKLFLSKLYVLDSFRGKGIGKQGIKFIKSTFNNPVIQLTVNKNNFNSIAFYKKVGFKIVEDVVTDIGNGFVMDDYVMEMQNLGDW
jgi:ribosomal protein S18 acetylase RimI-like enzyme